MSKVICIGVLSFTCSLVNLHGQNPEKKDTIQIKTPVEEVRELEEVVISASHAPAIRSEILRMVQIISSSEIERSTARDLATLLQEFGGMDVRQRGGYGVQADVGIRGGTFDQTLVLLNGINLSDPQTGHHHFNLPLGLNGIDRIEVLRGSGARIFGPNAFGGVIHVITKNPENPGLRAEVTGGSHGYKEASLSAAFDFLGTDHHLSFSGSAGDGHRKNTDFRNFHAFYRTRNNTPLLTWDLQAGYNRKAFGANGFYTPLFPEQFEATKTKFISVAVNPKRMDNLQLATYWRRHHDRFELFRNTPPDWYSGHNYHRSDVLGAHLRYRHITRLGITSLGLEYRYEGILSNVLGESMAQIIPVPGHQSAHFSHSYNRSGMSIMVEQSVYYKRLSLSGGLLAFFSSDLDRAVGLFPGIDAGWQLHPSLRWYFSANRTLRQPTFTDLFYEGPVNMGNPNLLPEEAISVESGFKGNINGISVDLAGFKRQGKQMIDWVRRPDEDIWRSMNHTRVDLYGAEVDVAIPLSFASITMNYSTIHAQKESGEMISNYVMDHLKHRFVFRIWWFAGERTSISLNTSWQQRAGHYAAYQQGQNLPVQPFPSFWLVDLKISQKIGNTIVFADLSNATNTPYFNHANLPQPGRGFRAGISYQIP